jgi:hydrogenase/urease accessory protein HupE
MQVIPRVSSSAILRAALTGWVLLVFALPVAAHRLAPSLIELRPAEGGAYHVRWKTPLQRPAGVDIDPVLPAHCERRSSPSAQPDATSVTLLWTVDCGERGLIGSELSVTGLVESATNALVNVELPDGRKFRTVLHADDPSFTVPERQSGWEVARDYATLGFEHIISGFDHLLFVLGLVLLVESRRLLIYTVTSFTLGHSVTLSLAALGFVRFPSTLVEVVIAGTIVALAAELGRPARPEPTLMRRFPWLMAFSFGLLHGLGFAGALAEIGLPQEEIPLALLTFNVGIELGQLAFVVAVLALRALIRDWLRAAPPWLVQLPVYGMGSIAVYWCLDRASGLF